MGPLVDYCDPCLPRFAHNRPIDKQVWQGEEKSISDIKVNVYGIIADLAKNNLGIACMVQGNSLVA
jgi:hypothetical protein